MTRFHSLPIRGRRRILVSLIFVAENPILTPQLQHLSASQDCGVGSLEPFFGWFLGHGKVIGIITIPFPRPEVDFLLPLSSSLFFLLLCLVIRRGRRGGSLSLSAELLLLLLLLSPSPLSPTSQWRCQQTIPSGRYVLLPQPTSSTATSQMANHPIQPRLCSSSRQRAPMSCLTLSGLPFHISSLTPSACVMPLFNSCSRNAKRSCFGLPQR